MIDKLVDMMQTFFGRRDLVMGEKTRRVPIGRKHYSFKEEIVVPAVEFGKTMFEGIPYVEFIERITEDCVKLVGLPEEALRRRGSKIYVDEFSHICYEHHRSKDGSGKQDFGRYNFRAKLAGV